MRKISCSAESNRMAINMTSPQRLCLLPHCLHDSVLFFFFSLSYFNEKNSPAGLSARLDGNFFLPPSTWFLLVTDATLTKGQTSSHWGGKKKRTKLPPPFSPGTAFLFGALEKQRTEEKVGCGGMDMPC